MEIRRSIDRGPSKMGWLDSKHTFSFGNYYDPDYMGVGPLRVINEDRVIPGAGFPTHPHDNMEIISYVLEGALEHKDSIGTGSVIRPGDVQRMSAGTGIRHSEFNHSNDEGVHFLQIWIVPEKRGIEPSYEQRSFSEADKRGKLALVASRDGAQGSVTIHQDASLYAGFFDEGESASIELAEGRTAWVQIARGMVNVNGFELRQGDGARIAEAGTISLDEGSQAEVLIFDLPSG